MAPGPSHDQTLDRAVATFRRFDANGDGIISRQELHDVLQKLSKGWDERRLNSLLDCVDTNRDGKIQYEEFIAWVLAGESRDGWDETRRACMASLRVTILGASGLRRADWFGSADPYCVCSIPGKAHSECRTDVVRGTVNPEWNQEFELDYFAPGDSLELRVMDKDFKVKGDDYLGTVLISGEELQKGQVSGNLPLVGAAAAATLSVRAVVLGAPLPPQEAQQKPDPHAVAQLQDMFPSWDRSTLEGLLAAHNSLDAAITTLLQWTGEPGATADGQCEADGATSGAKPRLEPVSPWYGQHPGAATGGGSVPSSPRRLLPEPVERREYDRLVAARLARDCSVGRHLAGVLKAATVWQRRATLAPATGGPTGERARSPSAEARTQDLRALSREEAISKGKELLRQRCQFLHLRQLQMADDGNCQFRAISQELFGSQLHHAEVRAEVVAQLRRGSDSYNAFFGAGEFEEYLHRMAKLRTWGDELTLRAAAEVFSIRIHVITSMETSWYLVYDPVPAPPGCRELFLTYVAPIHYNTLVPMR